MAAGDLRIGGAPVVTLRARDLPPSGPAFTEATILPGRGMMLLQARLRLPSGDVVDALFAPDVQQAAGELSGGPDDFAGNRAFAFGGALLAPYANRIRGRAVKGSREIEATIDGRPARLPRNWGGKAAGAEQYAMHGLILDTAIPFDADDHAIRGALDAGDFGGRWPGRAALGFEWRLDGGALALRIDVRNTGETDLPMGLGWHPYLALPSGRRDQATLRVPAAVRTEVDDYDQVLPTGRLLPVAGSPYDFNTARPLGDLYLDDCFTQLRREDGIVKVEVTDPAAGVGFRVTSPTAQVKAVQVYAPLGSGFVVVEPQFNLAEPYADIWPPGTDTGMASIPPGGSLSYEVQLEAFAVGT